MKNKNIPDALFSTIYKSKNTSNPIDEMCTILIYLKIREYLTIFPFLIKKSTAKLITRFNIIINNIILPIFNSEKNYRRNSKLCPK